MLKFHADQFVKIAGMLSYLQIVLDEPQTQDPGLEKLKNCQDYLKEDVISVLEAAGLRMSLKKARRIMEYDSAYRIHEDLFDLRGRIRDELEDGHFFHMNEEESKLWEPQEPLFAANFHARFPDANYDLAEAGKCLAVGRSTAAVFHLMRIVESGLRAVYLCMGITAALKGRNRNWARIFEKIDKAIEDKSKAAGGGWSERQTFQGLRVQIAAVGDAWRNPTMHVGMKHTQEEAEDIYRAVQTLMRKISSRMDQSGLPLA